MFCTRSDESLPFIRDLPTDRIARGKASPRGLVPEPDYYCTRVAWLTNDQQAEYLTRISHQVIRGPIWKHDWGGGRGFWGSKVAMIRGGGKRCLRALRGKDLRIEIDTLLPVDIFRNETPNHPLFQARKGTAWSWA